MKASELMFGDWVKLSKGNWSKNRLVGLTDIEMIAESVYLAEPIPLTEEILLKNRMRVFEHRNPWQEAKNLIKKWYSKDGKFYVSYYRVGDMFTYTVGNGVSRICSIMYVHELQHALRILKIEREIEL